MATHAIQCPAGKTVTLKSDQIWLKASVDGNNSIVDAQYHYNCPCCDKEHSRHASDQTVATMIVHGVPIELFPASREELDRIFGRDGFDTNEVINALRQAPNGSREIDAQIEEFILDPTNYGRIETAEDAIDNFETVDLLEEFEHLKPELERISLEIAVLDFDSDIKTRILERLSRMPNIPIGCLEQARYPLSMEILEGLKCRKSKGTNKPVEDGDLESMKRNITAQHVIGELIKGSSIPAATSRDILELARNLGSLNTSAN